MLSGLALVLILPFEAKIQYFVHFIFNSTLQLISGISSDLHKLLWYFNGTAIVVFFDIPLFQSALVFPNNLALYLKDLKSIILLNISIKIGCFIFRIKSLTTCPVKII